MVPKLTLYRDLVVAISYYYRIFELFRNIICPKEFMACNDLGYTPVTLN